MPKCIFLVLFILLSNFLTSQNTVPKKFNSLEKVGSIKFNPVTDNENFFLCDELNIMEYYQVNLRYKEGLKSIKKFFKPYTEALNLLCEKDGYITVRFVVNCRGETDRYRTSFYTKKFLRDEKNTELMKQLIQLIPEMGLWTAGEYEGVAYDAYKHLVFKIRGNKIVDILP